MGSLIPYVLLMISFLIAGMSEPAHTPPELRDLRVKLIDSEGVLHELTAFRCGDGGILRLKRGSVSYSIPLSSVKEIEVLELEDTYAKVKLHLKDGSEEILKLPSSMKCSAQSKLGIVSFYIEEVKRIELVQGESK